MRPTKIGILHAYKMNVLLIFGRFFRGGGALVDLRFPIKT